MNKALRFSIGILATPLLMVVVTLGALVAMVLQVIIGTYELGNTVLDKLEKLK